MCLCLYSLLQWLCLQAILFFWVSGYYRRERFLDGFWERSSRPERSPHG